LNSQLRVGTRGSTLARTQTTAVLTELTDLVPDLTVDEVVIKTNDADAGDKSRFVGALEQALIDDQIDLAVHSAKDLPGELDSRLVLAAVPMRANPADALCGASSLDELPNGARVGTNSLRRRSQLLALRPDLQVAPLHGNVDTRLGRLQAGDWDAIVLACAGLERLSRADAIGCALDQMVPAPGQGCLALQARADDAVVLRALAAINDSDSAACLMTERAAMAKLRASCNTPVGAHAQIFNGMIVVVGFIGLPDGSAWVRDEVSGDRSEAIDVGELLADRLTYAGGQDLLDQSEQWTI